jgi:hypothetical protein
LILCIYIYIINMAKSTNLTVFSQPGVATISNPKHHHHHHHDHHVHCMTTVLPRYTRGKRT